MCVSHAHPKTLFYLRTIFNASYTTEQFSAQTNLQKKAMEAGH